jgi:hypothetical protein
MSSGKPTLSIDLTQSPDVSPRIARPAGVKRPIQQNAVITSEPEVARKAEKNGSAMAAMADSQGGPRPAKREIGIAAGAADQPVIIDDSPVVTGAAG